MIFKDTLILIADNNRNDVGQVFTPDTITWRDDFIPVSLNTSPIIGSSTASLKFHKKNLVADITIDERILEYEFFEQDVFYHFGLGVSRICLDAPIMRTEICTIGLFKFICDKRIPNAFLLKNGNLKVVPYQKSRLKVVKV